MTKQKRNQDRRTGEAIEEESSLWRYEQTLVPNVENGMYAGVDEVGRGALAGPVYAAAVILDGASGGWFGVNDSKQLSRKKRETWYHYIHKNAIAVGVGIATVEEIDAMNILHASRLAMGRAIENLGIRVEFVLVDGIYMPLYEKSEPRQGSTVIDGDAKCLSIAAASIIAKVERDRYMTELSSLFPQYGFESHVGYATSLHLEKLKAFGPSACHRRSFAPVKNFQQLRLDI